MQGAHINLGGNLRAPCRCFFHNAWGGPHRSDTKRLVFKHVLPKGFVKVRYYGLLAPSRRRQLALVRQQLTPASVEPKTSTPAQSEPEPPTTPPTSTQPNSDAAAALPDPTSPAPVSDTPLLAELEDEPDSPDQPAAPAPPSSAPRCPTCGQPMRLRASLAPIGRSPP